MTSAFRNVDVSRIQRHIEKQVDSVIKAFVDDALGEMMAELNNGRQPEATPIEQPSKPIEQPEPQKNDQDYQIEQPKPPVLNTLDLANAQRQAEIEQRRQQVLNILSEHLTLGVSELHILLGGEEVCSRGTLNNDLKALAEDGKVYNADRKWHIISAIRLDLPELAVPTTNGINGHH